MAKYIGTLPVSGLGPWDRFSIGNVTYQIAGNAEFWDGKWEHSCFITGMPIGSGEGKPMPVVLLHPDDVATINNESDAAKSFRGQLESVRAARFFAVVENRDTALLDAHAGFLDGMIDFAGDYKGQASGGYLNGVHG